MTPKPVALLEVRREPGGVVGALLFTQGNVMLLAKKRGSLSPAATEKGRPWGDALSFSADRQRLGYLMIFTPLMTTAVTGTLGKPFCTPVVVAAIRSTTSIPAITLPNTA